MKGTLLFALCAVLFCSVAAEASSIVGSRSLLAKKSPEQKARKCFGLWNKALATEKASTVTARYRYGNNKYGTLIPTLSNHVRHTKQGIEDYFKNFLLKKPQGKITEIYAVQHAGYTIASGLYDFKLTTDGKVSTVPARFTYVFTSTCKIVAHHSSVKPEG